MLHDSLESSFQYCQGYNIICVVYKVMIVVWHNMHPFASFKYQIKRPPLRLRPSPFASVWRPGDRVQLSAVVDGPMVFVLTLMRPHVRRPKFGDSRRGAEDLAVYQGLHIFVLIVCISLTHIMRKHVVLCSEYIDICIQYTHLLSLPERENLRVHT